jgi:hypothetical protein
MMNNFSEREQIVEVVNKLFVYTDTLQWTKLLQDVFTEDVFFDMSSLGAGEAEQLKAADICAMWKNGFEGIDSVHHQAGNYIVNVKGNQSTVYAYAIALHFKSAALEGTMREFIGSYDLNLIKGAEGWRINSFKYNLKFMRGNLELK